MISPLQLIGANGAKSVNFKGNNSPVRYIAPKQTPDRDVFQSTVPKTKQGFAQKIKSAFTSPINYVSANISESKAIEYERLYGLADDYVSLKERHAEELNKNVIKYINASNVLNRTLHLAENKSVADDDSIEVRLNNDTYIEYDKIGNKKVPNSVISGSNEDENGVLSFSGYMNFAGSEIYENLVQYPEGSDLDYEADSVTVLSTNNSNNALSGDLAKKIGGPFVAYGLQKTANGTYYADSITVFHRDTQGRIKSATTYENVKIDDTLYDTNLPVQKRIFGITADEVIKAKIDNLGARDNVYYQDYDKFTGIVDSPELRDDAFKTVYSTCEKSSGALEILSDKSAKAYLDYEKSTDDGLLYSTKKMLNL